MGVAEVDQAGAFGMFGEAALEADGAQLVGFRPDGRMMVSSLS